jgi:hypothetical protein
LKSKTYNKPKVANKDIVCYKLLSRVTNPYYVDDENTPEEPINLYFTPWIWAPVPQEVIEGKAPFVPLEKRPSFEIRQSLLCEPYYYCYGGGIHTFKRLSSAKRYSRTGDVIFECIIPKGTEYVEGTTTISVKHAAYVSRGIRIIRECV